MSLNFEFKEKILSLVKAMMPDVELILFGSRARGTEHDRSDIDLALKGKGKLDILSVGEMRDILQATHIPYRIEVVDYYSVSPSMREMIDKEGILWKF